MVVIVASGFRPSCPHELQTVVVQWLTRCLATPDLAKVRWRAPRPPLMHASPLRALM